MRKNQQAPGELELVREFVNTLDLEPGVEALAGPGDLSRWLHEHGLVPADVTAKPADLRRALSLRESLRAILVAHTEGVPPPPEAGAALDELAVRARLALRFDAQYAEVVSGAEGIDAALGRLLAIVHGATVDGTWQRLKACRLDTCQWAFYDHTKNHSGAWCTMEVCGNRAKARAYRQRRTAQGG